MILDMCCGSRMFWFDRGNPDVVFCDIRRGEYVHPDRTIIVEPDVIADFRQLPFADATFDLVVFDPPHLTRAGTGSWMRHKYGVLSKDTWPDDIRRGFAEGFRVLKNGCPLIFKWNEIHIPTSEILALTPQKPAFGHPSGKRSDTHWICFINDEDNQL